MEGNSTLGIKVNLVDPDQPKNGEKKVLELQPVRLPIFFNNNF
jgi:hypothetical protein